MRIDMMAVHIVRFISRLEGAARALEARADQLTKDTETVDKELAAHAFGLREGARAIQEALNGDIPTIILGEYKVSPWCSRCAENYRTAGSSLCDDCIEYFNYHGWGSIEEKE